LALSKSVLIQMTETDLQQQRAHNWRTAGNAVRTLEDARAFVDSVGFCLMYPERSLLLVPAFIGAYAGSADGLPDARHAFADPRTEPATELMVRLLRERHAYEMSLFAGADLTVSAALFPFFYALVGDRNPKAAPRLRGQGAAISPLAITVFEAIQEKGPLSKKQLRDLAGGEPSNAALDRALSELWSILKITRVDYKEGDGAFWDVLYRWSPEVVKEGINISAPEAISALLGKYLESAVAASQEDVELFFSHLTSRSKVRETINALLGARELCLMPVGPKTFLRLTPIVEERRPNHIRNQRHG
jgi:23S rRNA pseudouridine2605 synthase